MENGLPTCLVVLLTMFFPVSEKVWESLLGDETHLAIVPVDTEWLRDIWVKFFSSTNQPSSPQKVEWNHLRLIIQTQLNLPRSENLPCQCTTLGELIHNSCFKPVHFEMICHAARANWHGIWYGKRSSALTII